MSAAGTAYAYACALLADGTIKCWGNEVSGQFGDGTASALRLTPVTVNGITNAIDLSIAQTSGSDGSSFACATLANGQVKCWGAASVNQLGYASTTTATSPVTVQGIFTAQKVFVTGNSSSSTVSQ